jgi:DNA-binding CsgD family transcriptional regulator
VGREPELAAALAAASRAPADGLVTVLLTGEAGIGKSTLLSAAVEALGWRTWLVRADEPQRRIPYAALTYALGTLHTVCDTSYTVSLLAELRDAFDVPHRACEALTRLLTALAATGPVAITIDDVDRLDEDSQAMLAVCLRRLSSAPIAVLATLRAGSVPLLDHLASDLTTVPLGPLDSADLAAALGVPVEVLAKADGNPFFAEELARADATGLTGHEALLRRLALDPATREVAELIAVFRRVRLDQLANVASAFDNLVRHNVITLDGAAYRFTHDLVAEALYEEIGPARRRELHERIAAGMLADRAGGLAVDLLELAWHVGECAKPGDADAIAVLIEAAREARSRAPVRAAELCARALALQPVDRAGIESILCRALARASRPGAAIDAGFAALATLPAGEDREHTVTALVGSLFSAGRIDEAIKVVEAEPAAGVGLRATHASLLAFAGRDADALAEAVVVEAEVAGAPTTAQVHVFCQLTMLSSMVYRHERTSALADQALAAAGTSATLRLQALAIGASASALAGLVPDARARLALVSGDSGLFHGELVTARIAADWFGGRWEQALRSLSTARAELIATRQTMLAGATRAIELSIRSWRGELDLAAGLAEPTEPLPRNVSGLLAVSVADYWAARGDAGAAERVIGSMDPAEPFGCALLGRLVDLLVAADRHTDALVALETLESVATGRFAPWSRVSLLRATGLVRGDLDALREAASVARAGSLEFEWARAVLAAGRDVDELVLAYQAFAAMGADGLRRAAGRSLRSLGAKVPRARTRSAGLLTETEERIARLVRQGMRNREIAATLNYTPRSVEVYLSRIYAKLGIGSRLALARMLDTTDRLG